MSQDFQVSSGAIFAVDPVVADPRADLITRAYPNPDPNFEQMTESEIEGFIHESDDFIAYGRDNGAEEMFLIGLEQQRRRARAHLDRRRGLNSLISLNSHADAAQKLALPEEALLGLPGDIVRTIDPYTESDPVAILSNTLVAFGNTVGPIPYFRVENTRHHLNLFIVHVGDSSKARKGTGWSTPRRMFGEVDNRWSEQRMVGGLSSGEGLIFAVRDPLVQKQPIKQGGRVIDYQEVIVDHGVDDKRLLCVEEEFSQTLKVSKREGNILSQIVRNAWDGLTLAPQTKTHPIRATGAHISIIGHITSAELLRHLTTTEQSNGFANRFCWFFVERSKLIPNPTGVPDDKLVPLIERLRDSVNFARRVNELRRDHKAELLWSEIYPSLSKAKPGLVGAIIARGEAQVMRLSGIFALLDTSEIVRPNHLKAALAVWDYSEKSVFRIFGELTGDPALDKVKEALRVSGSLNRTELSALFSHHAPQAELDRIMSELMRIGFATVEPRKTGGRSELVLCLAAK